jgi:glycosyltransferase involved in cell wall biosynthesis
MLNLFMSARIYLGVSMSDGISTSLLEAISSGSFPIQTNTSCASEWIEDGVNGFTVDYTNPRIITQKIVEALTNDDLVDRAAKLNRSIAEKRLSAESMISDHLSFYQLK